MIMFDDEQQISTIRGEVGQVVVPKAANYDYSSLELCLFSDSCASGHNLPYQHT